MKKQKVRTAPNRFIGDKAPDPNAGLELHHWQAQLVSRRLAIADAGGEGFKHGEVFNQLRRRLQAN